MRIKFNKDIEFLFKKIFFSEKYLLKKRLNRAIKNTYEEELLFLDKVVDLIPTIKDFLFLIIFK